MASRNPRMHGKVEGARGRCAVPGCRARGEYRAPVQPANFDGPGAYRLLCLDHVREHNTKYNYFAGMSPEEISDAQSPIAGWERPSRRFAHNSDPTPAWADFADPLDAIAARFRTADRGPPQRFTKEERRALSVLGLGEDAELHAVRHNYSKLVRRYHPDRNGGDRSHEAMLAKVKLCSLAESLGGVETLISHPATMTHAGYTQAERDALGIGDGMVRISVGCEDSEDLIADLERALVSV